MSATRLFFILFCLSFSSLYGQTTDSISKKSEVKEKIRKLPVFGNNKYKYNFNLFSQYYPIRENPRVGWLSSLRSDEKILFDFHPILTLSFFNNFKRKLSEDKLLSMGYYFAFRPHFRLYSQNSTPVQMPSYRIILGLQHLYRINERHFVGYALESGHYSNGQQGCALSSEFEDGSKECDSLFALINEDTNLSGLINRSNGDFTTNLTEITFQYRFISRFDDYNRPQQVHAFNFGIQVYHNNFLGFGDFGGFTDNSIAMYGRLRFLITYHYCYNWQSGYRINIDENIELIQGAHPWVNPLRMETTFTFFLPRHIGFYISYMYGHDDYNLRFVDSGHQFGVGLVWDMFPPVEIGRDTNDESD